MAKIGKASKLYQRVIAPKEDKQLEKDISYQENDFEICPQHSYRSQLQLQKNNEPHKPLRLVLTTTQETPNLNMQEWKEKIDHAHFVSLMKLPEDVSNHPELMLHAIKLEPRNISSVGPGLLNNRDFLISAAATNIHCLKFLRPQKLQSILNDEDLLKNVVKENPTTLVEIQRLNPKFVWKA